MKYLVLLIVLAVVVGIWRIRRTPDSSAEKPGPRRSALPQDMVACDHCGLHVPRAEALVLGHRAYCCAEHQRQHNT